MRTAMTAIIKKDLKSVMDNRRMFASLLIVPLVLVVFLPSLFLIMLRFAPADPDMQKMLELLPAAMRQGDWQQAAAGLMVNFLLPSFFLMIPVMTASIMAASAFVGEKEKHTLETLLYCPLSVRQIFRAKVMASFLLSMLVSLISFAVMLLVTELESYFLLGTLLVPGINWLVILALVSPTISLIAVTLIVRGSAKAQTVEESQQSAVFLILPVILLVVGQTTGLMLVNGWVLLGLGVVCGLIAFLLLKMCMGRFTYEMLLK
ncbi:MAG: ABC transporter permease [Oscillospiraceae bacterium]